MLYTLKITLSRIFKNNLNTSMLPVFLIISNDNLECRIEKILAQDTDLTQLNQLKNYISNAYNVIQSWLLDSGECILIDNCVIANLDATKLNELEAVVAAYELALTDTINIGIGLNLNDAALSLEAAQVANIKAMFYSDKVLEILNEHKALSKADDDGQHHKYTSMFVQTRPKGATFETVRPSHAKPIESESPQLESGVQREEEKKDQLKNLMQASKDIIDAAESQKELIEPTKAPTSMDSVTPTSSPSVAPQKDKGNDLESLKQHIVDILLKIRQNPHQVTQLKNKNPEAYETLMDTIQTLIEIAKKILNKEKETAIKKEEEEALANDLDSKTAKLVDGKLSESLGEDSFDYLEGDALHHILSGNDPVWSPIHINTKKEDKKRNYYLINKNSGKVLCLTCNVPKRELERRFTIDKNATDSLNKLINRVELKPEGPLPSGKVLSKEEIEKAEKPKVKRVNLPVGTQIDTGAQADRMMAGKIKVERADGTEGWVQVRAGKIQARYVPDSPRSILNPRAI